MTAWQVASLPFWVFGFVFCIIALCLGLGAHKKPKETKSDLMGQCAMGMIFGLPFLLVAAWMWS